MGFSVVGGKWLAEKNKIKASVASNRLWKWLAVKAQKNKIKAFQKEIDKRNKELECMADNEKEFLEQADVALKSALQYRDASLYVEIMWFREQHAKKCVVSRRNAISEIVALEKVKKKEIDGLHNGDFTTEMHFLFY